MEILPQEIDVIMYGHIAEAALREHSEALLVIYATAATMKRSPGSNGIPLSEAIGRLRELGIFSSAAHVRSLFRRGGGTFWDIKAGKLWLRSPALAAERLGADSTNRYRQIVSTRGLRTSAERRSALLAVCLPNGKPIRQHATRRLTGVSERTQRRHSKRGHFKALRQDADLTAASGLAQLWTRKQWAADNAEHGVYMAGTQLRKRIPNKYESCGRRLPAGRRSREMFAARPLNSFAKGALTVPRTFFKTDAAWRRCRKLKLGTPSAESYAFPFNVSYVQRDEGPWEAVAS